MLLFTQMAGGGHFVAGLDNQKSLAMQDNAKSYQRTVGGAPTNAKKKTISFWFKTPTPVADETAIGVVFAFSGSFDQLVIDDSGPKLTIDAIGANGGPWTTSCTGLTLADSTFYHGLVQIDTTQATDTNRVKIFVDGVDVTDTGSQYPDQNIDTGFGSNAGAALEGMCAGNNSGTWLIDEIASFDGQIIAVASVRDATTHKPKDLTGLTFGAQGGWWRFETGAAATGGQDYSGLGHDMTNTGYVDGDFSSTVP